MKKWFSKIISLILILFFSSCMTIGPDNRSEAVTEMQKLRTVSISTVPLVNDIGPIFRITAPNINTGLMVAGQMGINLGYRYFVLIESGSDRTVTGFIFQGTGGVTTETTISITVAFTNEEEFNPKYDVYQSSALIDGNSFVTRSGRIRLWTLFGTTLVGGTAIMLSALSVDYPAWNDPNCDAKMRAAERRGNARLIGGGLLVGASFLFTIPLW